jgi:iron complex transport system substrate-binding protein
MPFPRIVALQPSVSVTLDALGKLDHLVACTKWCVEQVPRLRKKNLPVLPDSWSSSDADMALLRELQPDLVIACVPYREESLRAILKTGIPVLALAPRSLEEIYADTRLLAAQVNARARGERLIEKMQQALADVSARAAVATVTGSTPGPANVPAPRVYAEEWTTPREFSITLSQPWVYELVRAAGGNPLGKPGEPAGWTSISWEDPDVLLLSWCGAGDRVPLRSTANIRGWKDLRAVRERRMYCVPDEFLNTPAIPSLLDGLPCIAHAVHPEIFAAPRRLRRLEEER